MCKLTVISYQCGHHFEPEGGISSAPGILDQGVLPFSRCCDGLLRTAVKKAEALCSILGHKVIHAEFDWGDCIQKGLRIKSDAKKARQKQMYSDAQKVGQEQIESEKEKQMKKERLNDVLWQARIGLVGAEQLVVASTVKTNALRDGPLVVCGTVPKWKSTEAEWKPEDYSAIVPARLRTTK